MQSYRTENYRKTCTWWGGYLENCKMYMLTPRECEVTQLVCEGEKYKDIAEKLFISERTVTKHVQNIFKKTEVTSKIELLKKLGEKAKIKDAAS